MEIILIDIGVFQNYILDNIRNLKLFGNTFITVITDPCLISNFKDLDVNIISTDELETFDFDSKIKLSKGFWANCSKRLFLLYSYIKKYNKKNCVHIENDYLIYFLANFDLNDKVWLTMDSPNRCIPGIVFISSYEQLEPLVQNYDFESNDMVNMAKFHNCNENVQSLPIIPPIQWNMIFDAAAIGQYLGGTHNGGIPGFINETCIIDYSKYTFHWIKEQELFVPMIKIEENFYKIAGLHIHSKKLLNFQGDNPIEKQLINFL